MITQLCNYKYLMKLSNAYNSIFAQFLRFCYRYIRDIQAKQRMRQTLRFNS